jgi:hypothetical protein
MRDIDFKQKATRYMKTGDSNIKKRGSITVEASIALPVFLCVIISIVSLIKIVYTHEIIQCALIETANEIASNSYLLRISGLQDLDASVREGLDQKAQQFEDQIQGLSDLNDVLSSGESFIDNPIEELKSIIAYFARSGYGDIKTELFNPIAKLYMKKYLSSGSGGDADKKLKALNIQNGFEGLDFNKSEYFENKNDDIIIAVSYRIDLPIPINIFPDLIIEQRASVKAWLGGDDASPIIEGKTDDSNNIWELDNLSRGRIIRSEFGANLPLNFPVISTFDAGKAVMIKSLDTTAESYQTGDPLVDTLTGYISELAQYKGQERPWGSKNIIIKEQDILQKELLLVIPQNTLTPRIQQILEECISIAATRGIKLIVERYGTKKSESNTENNTDNR